jgi:hypothetical protein
MNSNENDQDKSDCQRNREEYQTPEFVDFGNVATLTKGDHAPCSELGSLFSEADQD